MKYQYGKLFIDFYMRAPLIFEGLTVMFSLT